MKFRAFLSAFSSGGTTARGWQNGMVFLLYFAAAQLGLQLASLHGNVSPFWPASGVAVAALILGGRRLWIGIALGAFLTNFLTPIPWFVAVAIAVGNTLEALLAEWLYRRVAKLPELQGFAIPTAWMVAALLAPLVAAGVGAGSLGLSGATSFPHLGKMIATWWAGDSIGIWVVGPVLLALADYRKSGISFSARSLIKAIALIAILIGVCGYIFGKPNGSVLLFLTFPILLLATIWFGGSGAKLTCLGIVFYAVFAVNLTNAPFEAPDMNQIHLQLEGFLFAVAVTAQLLAIMDESQCIPLPALVLVGGWAVGGWIFSQLDQERRSLNDLRFESLTNEAQEWIRQRMDSYEDALRGGVNLFRSSDDVRRDEWRRYVEALDLPERYPEISGIGVIFPVRERELDSFIAKMRKEGASDLSIHPVPGVKPPPLDPGGWEHFVVGYIEPEATNLPALGLDVATEKNRQSAARIARDYGVPRLTARIALVQDPRQRPAFFLYLPMYRPDMRHDTVHSRRQAFLGWVYAPILAETFFQGILGDRNDQLRLSVFEGSNTDPAKQVFKSIAHSEAHFKRTTVVELGGQSFTCGWSPGPAFEVFRPDPLLNAITLAVVPALLAGLVVSLQTLGRRARELAEERTREWREVNARLQVEMGERSNAEAEAREAREVAEKASAAKSEFLATMSHEIRTPMNGVIGYTDLLAQSELTLEQRDWLRVIQNSGEALLTLINDILDFSKIEAGRLKLERIPFDPLKSVNEVVEITRIPAGSKKLSLSVHCENDLPARIMGDPTRFKQILLNLVSNAIKFTDKGFVSIRLDAAGSELAPLLRIEVQDSGLGIAEEKRSRLFHRFSQVDSSTTRRFGGTGLGLAICKHLIHLMHGRVGVTSALGVGTTIWFELPLEICAPETPIRTPRKGVAMEPRPIAPGKRILVAEDVPMNQKLAAILLTRLGCQVDLASNGREAVERALAGSYDLIYMDCQMPELDGLAATREIRAREGTRQTPIVALTASALDGDRDKCMEAGMNDYLTKPLTRSELIRSLNRWAGPGKPI